MPLPGWLSGQPELDALGAELAGGDLTELADALFEIDRKEIRYRVTGKEHRRGNPERAPRYQAKAKRANPQWSTSPT